MQKGNYFHIGSNQNNSDQEFFETLLTGSQFRLERIISQGQTTPEGQWYDQELDEWVFLVQGYASVEFENGSIIEMNPGDYLLIEAHKKHRVIATSKHPPCFWLALHGEFNTEPISFE